MSQKILSIQDVVIQGKKVLVRLDLNVSFDENGEIAEETRIKEALPTLLYLLKNDNSLIVVTHRSDTKGRSKEGSVEKIAVRLEELLKETVSPLPVKCVDDFLSSEGAKQISSQTKEEILMLENIRFYEGEEKNDPEFAQKLAELCDVCVIDAFGASHRAHASVVGICQYVPSYAGLLMNKEVATLENLLLNPAKPFTAIIGGSKISTKIQLIRKLIDVADHVILGGALANTFFLAQGHEVGTSLVEKNHTQTALDLLEFARSKGKQISLPVDVVCGNLDRESMEAATTCPIDAIPFDTSALDIGPESKQIFEDILLNSKTIMWNGPVGVFEKKPFHKGTEALARSISSQTNATTIIGGGDTLAAIHELGVPNTFTHVSTGGGAMLEFIEKGTLPALDALRASQAS